MAATQYYGTGRRKTSTARVFLKSGSGNITINDRSIDDFFGVDHHNVVPGIDMGGILGLVFATQTMGYLRRHAAQSFSFCINDIPVIFGSLLVC